MYSSSEVSNITNNKIDTFVFPLVTRIYLLQENVSFVIPWVVGFITFMALEAVSMVYSNVLRDHVNKVSMKMFTLLMESSGAK